MNFDEFPVYKQQIIWLMMDCEKRPVVADVINGLAITRIAEHPGQWDITHVLSGRKIDCASTNSREQAEKYLRALVPLTDWPKLDWQELEADDDLALSVHEIAESDDMFN